LIAPAPGKSTKVEQTVHHNTTTKVAIQRRLVTI